MTVTSASVVSSPFPSDSHQEKGVDLRFALTSLVTAGFVDPVNERMVPVTCLAVEDGLLV